MRHEDDFSLGDRAGVKEATNVLQTLNPEWADEVAGRSHGGLPEC